MRQTELLYLRPGVEVRIRDPLLGSVRAVIVRQDRPARRTYVRRFDFGTGDFSPASLPIEPDDVIELHDRFGRRRAI